MNSPKTVQIEIKNLCKEYKISTRKRTGMWEALSNLFVPQSTYIKAVQSINLTVEKGEAVGFIGPNGAGKSTTIKMLTGILVPTSGEIRVLGVEPYKERKRNAWHIGVVFGQRTQLWWDLPGSESFKLLKHIYKISDRDYCMKMELFNDLLDLKNFIHIPVRQMSLGQRMRADIGASLLHDPQIIYFDEPTIGLDVVAKDKIRNFIRYLNEEKGITMFFTTHDMQDIEKTCKRMVIIDSGKIIYDGSIREIKEKYGEHRVLIVDFKNKCNALSIPGAETIREEGLRTWIRFKKDEITAAHLISEVAKNCEIRDLAIQETEIESIIRKIYRKEVDFAHATVP